VPFTAFWTLYPKKVGKAETERKWKQMPHRDRVAAMEALPRHVRYWQQTGTERKFIKDPVRWLRAGAWDDDLAVVSTPPRRGHEDAFGNWIGT
jgi:hypothetical protein